jgi:hypothetical protein
MDTSSIKFENNDGVEVSEFQLDNFNDRVRFTVIQKVEAPGLRIERLTTGFDLDIAGAEYLVAKLQEHIRIAKLVRGR